MYIKILEEHLIFRLSWLYYYQITRQHKLKFFCFFLITYGVLILLLTEFIPQCLGKLTPLHLWILKAVWKRAREAQYCVGGCSTIQVWTMLLAKGNKFNTSLSNQSPLSWLWFPTNLCFVSPAQIRDTSAFSSPSHQQAIYLFFDKVQCIIGNETLIHQRETVIIIFQAFADNFFPYFVTLLTDEDWQTVMI